MGDLTGDRDKIRDAMIERISESGVSGATFATRPKWHTWLDGVYGGYSFSTRMAHSKSEPIKYSCMVDIQEVQRG